MRGGFFLQIIQNLVGILHFGDISVRLTTFQVISSHMWLVADVLGGTAIESKDPLIVCEQKSYGIRVDLEISYIIPWGEWRGRDWEGKEHLIGHSSSVWNLKKIWPMMVKRKRDKGTINRSDIY